MNLKIKLSNEKLFLGCKILVGFLFILIEWSYFFLFYLKEETYARDGVFSAVLFAGAGFVLTRYCKISIREAKKGGFLFGIPFGALLVLGRIVSEGRLPELWSSFGVIARYGVSFLGSVLFWVQIASLFLDYILRLKRPEAEWPRIGKMKRMHWLLCWGGMFLCYLPCYISFFPGNMGYDSKRITEQALGLRPFDNFQPFMHTILWTACIKLEQLFGIKLFALVFYSVMQMIIITAVFTLVLYRMTCRKMPRFILVCSFLFYAFCPAIVMFSFITTKDVLFGAFVLLYLILLVKLTEDREEGTKRDWLILAFLGLAASLFRNNMIYAILTFIPFLLLGFRKRRGLALFSAMLTLILYFIITGPVFKGMGILEGYQREKLSVPLSQIASVVHYTPDSLTAEEHEIVRLFIPDVELYERKFADPIKYTFNEEEYARNTGKFWRLWFELFKRKPDYYLDAFLVLNAPLWYLEDDSVVPYISVGKFSRHYTFEWQSQIPVLHNLYIQMAEYEQAEKTIYRIPGIRQFFLISTPIWILWGAFIFLGIKRRLRDIIPLVPLLLLWLTHLLGPVSNFRYIYPIFVAYPVILMIVIERDSFLPAIKKGGGDTHENSNKADETIH